MTARSLVPLLRPLTDREAAVHEMRNRLTYIAGTARTLRRKLENGRVDPKTIETRLEKIERAAWSIEAALRSVED
jgi:SOS response regulatory protein OraA/RecX